MRLHYDALPDGIRRTVSHLILPIAVAIAVLTIWAMADFTETFLLPAAAILIAAGAASALRARWNYLRKAAYQEGLVDGYLRGVAERLRDEQDAS